MLPIYFINFPFTHRVTEFLISVRHRSGSWFSASFGANLKSCPLFSAKDSGRNWISGSSMYVSKQLWGQYGVISNCDLGILCLALFQLQKTWNFQNVQRKDHPGDCFFQNEYGLYYGVLPCFEIKLDKFVEICPHHVCKAGVEINLRTNICAPDCFRVVQTRLLWTEYLLLIVIVVHLISLARIFALDCYCCAPDIFSPNICSWLLPAPFSCSPLIEVRTESSPSPLSTQIPPVGEIVATTVDLYALLQCSLIAANASSDSSSSTTISAGLPTTWQQAQCIQEIYAAF